MSINDLLAFAADTRFAIESIKTVVIDAKLASRTGLPSGEEWLEVCGYRHSEGVDAPVCWTEYYINRAYAAVGRLLQRHTGPIFPLIEDMFGQSIIEVQQQISATLISPALAAGLEVKDGSAALEVRRAYKTSRGENCPGHDQHSSGIPLPARDDDASRQGLAACRTWDCPTAAARPGTRMASAVPRPRAGA